MANSKKRCKQCKDYVPVETGVQLPVGFFCEFAHAIDFAYKKKAKNEAKAQRVQHRKDKESIKPKSKWLAELQALVNKYVRLRDSALGCCSCGKSASWQGQWHASHLYSRGHSSALRFNLWNINKSCSICNNHLSGNIGEYKSRIINKIGVERYEWLESHKSDPKSFDIEWIKRAIKITRKAIKRLEKRLQLCCA